MINVSLRSGGNFYIRARGLMTTGGGGGSSGIIESVGHLYGGPSLQRLGPTLLGGGGFQFGFTNHGPDSFTVLATTNLALPSSNWTALGPPTLNGAGFYQFTDSASSNYPQRFYQVRSP